MINITVKTLDSQNHTFSLDDDQITVRGFKEHIAESVAVPADSQRLIYCGRVLQDETKLNDYDINEKVIHLVQRAPPQRGQRGNDFGQTQGQNAQRTHYRLTRAQMHGNAMYLGAMSVPAEVVENHGLPVPQLSNSLSNSRLIGARRMLDRANELMDRLDDPTCPLNPPPSENNQPPLSQQVQVQELETDHEDTNDGRNNNGARLAEAAVAAIVAALSAAGAHNVTLFRGNSDEGADARSTSDTNDDNQQDAQQQQPQPEQGSTSNSDAQTNRRVPQQLPRPPQMAELLERLLSTQDRLRPYIECYRLLMLADPSLPPGAGPEGVEENQRLVDGVSESLHYMSHACHALSDIIVDMGQQPPRNLRCRPIIIQHSAILQPGIPIQVEAHISLHGRNANNNGSEESTEASGTAAQSESTETNAEQSNQQQESESSAQQATEQSQQEQAQTPFGTVFNLSNNVDVLMEVSPEGNIETATASEQNQSGETNNNNNNTGRINGAGVFPWGSAPLPDFIRNLMQTVAGYTVQGGITTATITTQSPPLTAGGQQPIATSLDSGSTNAGQSTQARSNVGTHPTTATQTRSTSRPHVFQQQTHPLGIGMSIGAGLEFDPFLPCNSYHVRRGPPATPSTVTATSQGTRTSQTPAIETTAQTQPASTSTTTTNASTTNTTPPMSSQPRSSNLIANILRGILFSTGGDQQEQEMDEAEIIDNAIPILMGGNIHGGNVGAGRGSGTPTLIDLLQDRELIMNRQGREDNFLYNLLMVLAENITLERFVRLCLGQSEQIVHLRRPVQEFFQRSFPNCTPEMIQEQTTEQLVSPIRPYLQNLLTVEEDIGTRNGSRIDIPATVESILRRHIRDTLRVFSNTEIDDTRFVQEVLTLLDRLAKQLYAVLRYSIRGGSAGLETLATRIARGVVQGTHPVPREWMLNNFIMYFRIYTGRLVQPPESEIIPLLIYKDAPSAPAHPPTQTQTENVPMETETVEERRVYEAAIPDDGEEIPETFPGSDILPPDWVPIIARDRVRQRRQLQMQGMTNGGVTAFSDAYLGTLPTKRRKIIEQQKPRLLVSPTPNHSAITASMERLVREGVGRAGVEEVDGATIAVAADPGVRRAFGQAIRDCLNPRRYTPPDFPDPLRFPNATKYFAEQERPPK